jgi:hypothetical protein
MGSVILRWRTGDPSLWQPGQRVSQRVRVFPWCLTPPLSLWRVIKVEDWAEIRRFGPRRCRSRRSLGG